MTHKELHRQHRVGWLRASVLGANDGIISTSSLIIGVASAHSAYDSVLVAAAAGLVAGAISMAAGEYVSVCAQSDTEKSDLALERKSLINHYEEEVIELAEIYEERGVESTLALKVARQMMAHDALGAHARDDIGIAIHSTAQPLLAAFSSALSFIVGAALPLAIVIFNGDKNLTVTVALSALVFLAVLGALSAFLGAAKIYTGVLRVTLWGALAMTVTSLIGTTFNGV